MSYLGRKTPGKSSIVPIEGNVPTEGNSANRSSTAHTLANASTPDLKTKFKNTGSRQSTDPAKVVPVGSLNDGEPGNLSARVDGEYTPKPGLKSNILSRFFSIFSNSKINPADRYQADSDLERSGDSTPPVSLYRRDDGPEALTPTASDVGRSDGLDVSTSPAFHGSSDDGSKASKALHLGVPTLGFEQPTVQEELEEKAASVLDSDDEDDSGSVSGSGSVSVSSEIYSEEEEIDDEEIAPVASSTRAVSKPVISDEKLDKKLEKALEHGKRVPLFEDVVPSIRTSDDAKAAIRDVLKNNDKITKDILCYVKSGIKGDEKNAQIFKTRGYYKEYGQLITLEDTKVSLGQFGKANNQLLFLTVCLEAYVHEKFHNGLPLLEQDELDFLGQLYTVLKQVDKTVEEELFAGHSRNRSRLDGDSIVYDRTGGNTSSVVRSYLHDLVEFNTVHKQQGVSKKAPPAEIRVIIQNYLNPEVALTPITHEAVMTQLENPKYTTNQRKDDVVQVKKLLNYDYEMSKPPIGVELDKGKDTYTLEKDFEDYVNDLSSNSLTLDELLAKLDKSFDDDKQKLEMLLTHFDRLFAALKYDDGDSDLRNKYMSFAKKVAEKFFEDPSSADASRGFFQKMDIAFRKIEIEAYRIHVSGVYDRPFSASHAMLTEIGEDKLNSAINNPGAFFEILEDDRFRGEIRAKFLEHSSVTGNRGQHGPNSVQTAMRLLPSILSACQDHYAEESVEHNVAKDVQDVTKSSHLRKLTAATGLHDIGRVKDSEIPTGYASSFITYDYLLGSLGCSHAEAALYSFAAANKDIIDPKIYGANVFTDKFDDLYVTLKESETIFVAESLGFDVYSADIDEIKEFLRRSFQLFSHVIGTAVQLQRNGEAEFNESTNFLTKDGKNPALIEEAKRLASEYKSV